MLSAFKNFAVTFVIAAVVFGIVGYFATRFVTATVSDILDSEITELDSILSAETETESGTQSGAEGSESSSSDTENPAAEQTPAGESFAFLVITSGYRPELFRDYLPTTADLDSLRSKIAGYVTASDSFGVLSKRYRERQATSITLVRADKERREYTYTYISPETRVYTSTGYHTLGEVYDLYDYTNIPQYVTSLTGVTINYTFLLDGFNFDEFLTLMGTVYVNNPKDIYSDGVYHTTRSGYSVERLNENGEKITDQYPNSLVLAAGNTEYNQYSSHIMNTLKERSSADIEAKGKFTVELVKTYLGKLAAMDKETFRTTMQALLILSDAQSATKTWNADGTVTEEPATPILETDFTEADIDSVYEMINAATYFSDSVIAYPGNYLQETDSHDAYFDPSIRDAVKQFLPYRFTAK